MTTVRNDIFRSVLVASLLILAVGIWLGTRIPRGILTFQDELFTAERAREMLIQGRDSVYFNFEHSFAKPPLQYWLTTLSLPRLDNPATAVRIWPLVYGLLTAIAVGWLAFLVAPDRPWLIPLSVAILISAPVFSTEARRALLDTGLMFFTTAAIGFAELARRRPVWWLGVAAMCWLGALQKLPLIFLPWLIIIVWRVTQDSEREHLRMRWLIGGALLAIALVSIWPVYQYAKYGMPVTKAFAGDDLNDLFGERRLGSRPYFDVLTGLMATGWAGGGFALAAAAIFVFSRKDRPPPLVMEMSILSLVIVFLAVIFNFRSVRYVMPVVPCLVVVLAFLIHWLAEKNEKMRVRASAFAILLIVGGFVQSEIKMHHRSRDASVEREVAQELGKLQAPAMSTLLIKGEPPSKRILRSGSFYLFYGALRFPIKQYSISELLRMPPPGPVIGVCAVRDFPAVQAAYPGVGTVLARDEFICWRAGTER
ncbi:MAG: phospholipid carrier-dependent glycosyltransferase [Verrucomicrobiota bacterium]